MINHREIFDKHLIEAGMTKKTLNTFHGYMTGYIGNNFDFFLLNLKILRPRTIPSLTIKLQFLQHKTRFISTHHSSTLPKCSRHDSNMPPIKQKIYIRTSIVSSTISYNIDNMYLCNMKSAFYNP